MELVTLLDLTALKGGDAAVGIVEVVRDSAPEVKTFMGRPINGINGYVTRRKTLPGGSTLGGTLFRNANEGTAREASKYERILQECFYLDGQLEVDEQIVKAQAGDQPGDILALESQGQIIAKFLGLGRQFYYGRDRDAKGFFGVRALCDDDMVLKGGSVATGATESVYFIRNALDGLHFLYGNNIGLQAGQWMRQRINDTTTDANPYFAYVNNFSGFIGVGMNHPMSVGRVANLDNTGTSGKFITDKMVARMISLFPVGFPPTHICMSRRQRYWLQQSRSVVSQGNLAAAVPLVFPLVPAESNGIPIVCTDAIALTEAIETVGAAL